MSWFRNPFRRKKAATPPVAGKLRHVYTDAAGADWFEYANPVTMPVKRLIAMEVASTYLDIGISREKFVQLFDMFEEYVNGGKNTKASFVVQEIRVRLELKQIDCMYELAAAFFVSKDEDKNGYDADAQAAKIELWKADKDAADFFLRRLLTAMPEFSSLSEQAIRDYLKSQKLQLQKLDILLSREKSAKSLPTTTKPTTK